MHILRALYWPFLGSKYNPHRSFLGFVSQCAEAIHYCRGLRLLPLRPLQRQNLDSDGRPQELSPRLRPLELDGLLTNGLLVVQLG